MARQPARVTCFGITDCVCYDNWPVPAIARLQRLARVPLLMDYLGRRGVIEHLQAHSRLSDFLRGVYDRAKLTPEAIGEYLRPLRGTAAERERFQRFLLAGNARYTLQAVSGLQRYHGPTCVVWAADDAYLSPSWGRKLYEDIPGARRFELVPFCGHFWPEERPSEFASVLGEFLAEHLLADGEAAPSSNPEPPEVSLPRASGDDDRQLAPAPSAAERS